MKEYTLIFATPGVGLGETIEKLKSELDADFEDIERTIIEDTRVEEFLKTIDASYGKSTDITMGTITYHLPRSVIGDLWKDAVKRCLSKLHRSESGKSFRILSGHMIYYSELRKDFFSVVVGDYLSQDEIKPSRVLVLVDDIYDMYTRLPELYNLDMGTWDAIKKQEKDGIIEDVNSLSFERSSSLISTLKVSYLLQLLFWRYSEAITAENLSRQLGAKFLVWSVKQSIESIKVWLQESNPISIYLSHPITEPRKERNKSDHWPEFIKEVNYLQKMLSKQKITLVMPTGIDELRFQSINQKYTGYLENRWPLITDDKLLYSQPLDISDIDYNCFFKPQYYNVLQKKLSILNGEYPEPLKIELNAFLQILTQEIKNQISFRDFLLVYNTDGLIVYRPYYSTEPKLNISRGVDAEIDLCKSIIRLKNQKHVVFIHFRSDVNSMLEALKMESPGRLENNFINIFHKILRERGFYIDKDISERLVKTRGTIVQSESVLSKAGITSANRKRFQGIFQDIWNESKLETFKQYLTGWIQVEEDLIGVWICNDFNEIKSGISNIADFLRDGKQEGKNWEIDPDLFPNDIIPMER